MANKKVYLGSNNFFTLTVLSVAALGLMVTTMAVQQQTSTESEASYESDCIRKPLVTHTGSVNRSNSVTYTISVKNTAPKECIQQRDYFLTAKFPNSSNWTGTFVNANGNVVTKAHNLAGQGSKTFTFTAKPNSNVSNGYHKIYVGAADVLRPTEYATYIALDYYKD